MTVAELIEELKKMPQDMTVVREDDTDYVGVWKVEVMKAPGKGIRYYHPEIGMTRTHGAVFIW